MISRTTRRFQEAYAKLPESIKQQAKTAFKRFQQNPEHPGLRFKKVHEREPIFSVRISRGYRAVGVRKRGGIIWFWIGGHADYEKLLRQL